MNYDIMQSGERIRQLRIQAKYTQETLAKKLSIDRSLLSHVEAGKRGCSVDLFVRLSAFFDVSLDLLILGREHAVSSDAKEQAQLKVDIEELIQQLDDFKRKL